MLSPTETTVINIGVLLILGMVFVASYLYLPDHVTKITRRATFYFSGMDGGAASTGNGGLVEVDTGLAGAPLAEGSLFKGEL